MTHEELEWKMQERRMLLESLRHAIDVDMCGDDTVRSAFDVVCMVLERIQHSDESVMQIRRECQQMTEMCRKLFIQAVLPCPQ